jgi:S-adenosylmethionine-dependent methyltransferase
MLARAGHSVVVVDPDANMLAIAREELSREADDVAARVQLVMADGEAAGSAVGTEFDLACCHSVVMYEDDPGPLLASVVRLVRRGGLISVLSLNSEASAMRSGLQGRWREAAAILMGFQTNAQYVASAEHRREDVAKMLEAAGARIIGWQGVGVFTDHLRETLVVDDPEEVYQAEWLAGQRDPYRQVARCFHMLAERMR